MPKKGQMFHHESYEYLGKEDIRLINKAKETEETPIYTFSDHTKCYILRSKCGTASNHICGGERDTATGELVEKCIHCRFFFPVPKFKDVTP